MNDNTRRQWDVYQAEHVPCPDCAWLLLYLVADHNASTGVTHPGYSRLASRTRRSRSWISTHLRHLERDGHIVLAKAGKWTGRAHDAAAEYVIPWLHNRPASVQIPTETSNHAHRLSVQIPTEKRTDRRTEKRTTSLPYGKTSDAAARAAPAVVAQPPGRVDENGAFHPAFCACSDCVEVGATNVA